MMNPMYALCPHCTFPVVVHPVEIGSPRRCRQCREEYVPGEAPPEDKALGLRLRNLGIRNSLRALVRQQRRTMR